MSLAKLYREKVLKPADVARTALQARQRHNGAGTGSSVAGGTFITQNPNEAGVNLVVESYETSKLTQLEQKQRELRDMQETLAKKKLDYERRLSAVKEREDALKRRKEDFTRRATETSEHIHAADAKVCRATRRIDSEIKKRQAVERQIEHALTELGGVETQCAATKANLDAYSCYEDFLSEVVDASESFSSIGEVLTRYETLMGTHEELHGLNGTHVEAMDACARDTQALLQESENEALVLHSELLRYGETLDRLTRSNQSLETEFTLLSQGRHGTSRLSAEIQMSVQNLYEITQASFSSSRRRPLTAALAGHGSSSKHPAAAAASRSGVQPMSRSSSVASLLGARQSSSSSQSPPHTSSRRILSLLKRIHARIVELDAIKAEFRAVQIATHSREPMARSFSMKSVSSSHNTSETSTLSSGGGWDENSPFLPPIFPSACK